MSVLTKELLVHDIILPIEPHDVSPVIWNALVSGRYEAKEAHHVKRLLRPGDRILELGAGIGVISAVMARQPNVQVWSVDANPHTVSLARRVASANGLTNISFDHRLLTVGGGQTHKFYIRHDFWMSSMIESQGPYIEVIDLPASDIQDYIKKYKINVLVMDIEGAERGLLETADLSSIDRVFLELHDHLYGLAGLRDIFLAMSQKGFGYDPRNSSGACVQFSRDYGELRSYIDN